MTNTWHPRAGRAGLASLLVLAACAAPVTPSPEPATPGAAGADEAAWDTVSRTLPTGVTLDPAGDAVPVGSFPLAFTLAPDPRYAVTILSGWREQGLEVVDREAGRVVQRVAQPAAFLGLAFSPDGRTLFASGGNQDVIYRYDWGADLLTFRDSIVLAAPNRSVGHLPGEPMTPGRPQQVGLHFPAGIALSPDGDRLYVAENLGDLLAVVDVGSGRVVQRFPAGRYPYGVVVAPDGTVYVSAWSQSTVAVFVPTEDGLEPDGAIIVGRHPSAMVLSEDGSRLFVASASTDRVAVVDTRERRLITELLDPAPHGPGEGSTPNALALSKDGRRLFVAEADNNAVAVFDLSSRTAGLRSGLGRDLLAGRIPADWYPTDVEIRGDTLLTLSAKGLGTRPNPELPQPGQARRLRQVEENYTLGQLDGTLRTVPGGAALRGGDLRRMTARVVAANHWDLPRRGASAAYPPFEHVIYVIKENRTYDQVFGDMPEGDGDSSLVFFPREVSPNHHALADRFGLFDRFFVNAEVSADGHNWSTAAYASDYVEKTVPSNYAGLRPSYDYEGTNRGFANIPPEGEDVAEPSQGYIWDLANRAGITFRNYGEFVIPEDVDLDDPMPEGYRGVKPFLAVHTNPDYAGFDMNIPDQDRADVFLRDLQEFERTGEMPQLMILRLPNDHTAGGRAGAPTPEAYMADNDLALGRIVEAVSRSRFWKSTVFFILEDDAQNGPDHVDSHRSPLLVVSAYGRPGVSHRFANTTDVIATMSDILGMGSLSQFDHYGRPLRGIFADRPDLEPYTALVPAVDLDERNAIDNPGADASRHIDLRFEDSVDDILFNRILWAMIKGPDVPYPGTTRMPVLEWQRSR